MTARLVTPIAAVVALLAIAGCDQRPRGNDPWSTPQTSGSSTGSPANPKEEAARTFAAQIMCDTQIAVAKSPGLRDNPAWAKRPRGWHGNYQAQSLVVAVQVTPALISAAVEQWATNRGKASEEKNEAESKLLKQFCPSDHRTFLLLVKPIVKTTDQPVGGSGVRPYAEMWKVSLGPIADSLALESVDGARGSVVRSEKTLDEALDTRTEVASCLVYLQDVVNPESEPLFTLHFSNIHHSVKEDITGGEWVGTTSPEDLRIRFETGEVKLLQMVQEGTSWDTIEADYLGSRRSVITAELGGSTEFMLNLAKDLLIGLLFKLL